jgi:hypothetical protein
MKKKTLPASNENSSESFDNIYLDALLWLTPTIPETFETIGGVTTISYSFGSAEIAPSIAGRGRETP